ncbi:MAG: hypothetical protein ACRDPM_13740 [Solirubrobacteraceae bacterium]
MAFLPQTIAAFAVASTVPALTRRIGTPFVAVIGVALALIALVVTGLVAHSARADMPRRRGAATACVAALDEPATL